MTWDVESLDCRWDQRKETRRCLPTKHGTQIKEHQVAETGEEERDHTISQWKLAKRLFNILLVDERVGAGLEQLPGAASQTIEIG